MNNRQFLYKIINLIIVVVVVSAINFFATKYYVGKIIDQEMQNRNMTIDQVELSQGEKSGDKNAETSEEDLKNRVLGFKEASGTIIEVKDDYIRIKPSGDLLGGINDQAFSVDYLKDRIVKITADTRILKEETIEKDGVVVTIKKISDLKVGDYVMITSRESIGSKSEFIASVLNLPL